MPCIKDFYNDQLHARIFDSRDEMGACAGKEAGACLRELLRTKPEVNVMFAAAPSQNETLAALIADSDIDWTRVNAFHMDEYVGLPQTHSASFRNYLCRTIFDRFPFKHVHLINGNAPDAEAEARRYSALLAAYSLDLCLLGVGENGHIAFNDPSVADFQDPCLVKVVKLENACRMQQVNDGCFERLEDVPTHALTVTIPGLTRAGHLFCSVPGDTKAEAVHAMLAQPVSIACPASILRRHAGVELYLDSAAGKHML